MRNTFRVRYQIACACCAMTLLLSASASAERYKVATLGDSPVSYIEHRNSLNDTSQVAWTELYQQSSPVSPNPNPMYPRARLTDASNVSVSGWPGSRTTDLHGLLSSFGSTFSSDFISRAEDINNDGDVVGYATDTPLEFRRHAALWLKRSSGTYQVIDLHAALEAHGMLGGAYDMTASYGVSERIGDYVFIAGYSRTSLASGSIPIVWQVDWRDKSVAQIYELPVPSQTGMGYGMLYDVATRYEGGTIEIAAVGGVGGQAGGQAYLSGYGYKARVDSGSLVGLGRRYTPQVTGNGYATSAGNRLEVFNDRFYAVGYALTNSGNAEAFIWEDDLNVETGGALNSGNVAIGMGLGERTDPGVIPGYLQVVGASTVSAGAVGSGNANSQSALSAFHAYSDVASAPNLSRTCDLNAELPTAASSIEVATDLNSFGAMVGWSGTKAVVAVPDRGMAPELKFYERVNPQGLNFWWSELVGLGGGSGRIVYSEEPGCFEATSCDGGAGALQTPAGFLYAIVPEGQDGGTSTTSDRYDSVSLPSRNNLNFPTYGAVQAISTNAHWYNTAGPAYEPNRINPGSSGYVQAIAQDDSGVCHVSDVYDMSSVAIERNPCHEGTDGWWSPRGVYRDCVGGSGINEACETDITRAAAHCGACGAVCNATCYAGGGTCSGGTCTGTPIQDAREVHNGKPDNDTYANREYIGTWNEDQNIWGRSIGGLTAFPIDDVDHYEFRVDDYYRVSGNWTTHGGTPDYDQSDYNNQPQPAVQIEAPAGQDLEVTVRIQCNRFPAAGLPAVLLSVKTFVVGGAYESFTVGNQGREYSVTRTVPAGGYRYIEMHPDCGPGGDDSAPGVSSDPSGLDDGVYVDVVVSHAGGESSCGRQYVLRVGNDVD